MDRCSRKLGREERKGKKRGGEKKEGGKEEWEKGGIGEDWN